MANHRCEVSTVMVSRPTGPYESIGLWEPGLEHPVLWHFRGPMSTFEAIVEWA